MVPPELKTIGKYEVLDRIAEGDLAEVYKARVESIAGFRRLFAIKRIRPHLAADTGFAGWIEEEARSAGHLSHGNIVQLLDLGREGHDGVLYLVMEYVDGWDLGRVLDKAREVGRPLPANHAVWIGLQLLKGLEYAHSRTVERDGEQVALDLVHRDVSPSNILLSRQGEVKLADFGIARASLKMMQTHPDLASRRFDYVSPEQARDDAVGQQADLFGVALVLYECLTLVHPFRRESDFETLQAIKEGKAKPLGQVRGGLPEGLVEAVMQGLAPDPADRAPDATAFKDALADVLHGAGDVFTQESLATYLRDLFGDEEASEDADGQLDIGGFDADELPDLPSRPDQTLPAPEGHPGVVDPEDDDAKTVVMSRGTPAAMTMIPQDDGDGLADDDDDIGLGDDLVAEEWAADEAATVVQPGLEGRLAELKARAAKGGFDAEEATRVRADTAKLLAELEAAGVEDPAAASNPSSAWVAGAVSAVLMLIVGSLLGAALTVVFGRAGGMVVNPPMLDVRGAPDIALRVFVDGDEVSGPTQVTPGPHAVRVDVAGDTPWEVDLELESGEYRLMMIEAHELAPADDAGDEVPGDGGEADGEAADAE